jgi:hypothetical protein
MRRSVGGGEDASEGSAGGASCAVEGRRTCCWGDLADLTVLYSHASHKLFVLVLSNL